ncbi:MAG: hypothetical protein QOJ15_11332 [Bradyrhizobium sp.]|jgi:hypothetical protein|nr:hypothetical protein [Bradyrhizobium sp.]
MHFTETGNCNGHKNRVTTTRHGKTNMRRKIGLSPRMQKLLRRNHGRSQQPGYCAHLNLDKPAAPTARPPRVKEHEELSVVAPPRIDMNIMSRKSLADVTKPLGPSLPRRSNAIMRQFLQWFFRNRETGEVTIAQAPNLVLWVVIAAGILLWVLPSSGNPPAALGIVFKGGLLIWAVDEVFRGVNPWRRCLGAAVLGYELTTIL